MNNKKKIIWIDITNTPHVNVLLPIINKLQEKYRLFITARDFSETIPLLRQKNIEFHIIGKYKGKNRINKALGMFSRIMALLIKVPYYDISISMGGNYSAGICRLRGKKSIIFSDNDLSFKGISFKYGDYFFFPEAFNSEIIEKKYGLNKNQIIKFKGYKEDIYVADYIPDENFLMSVPFDDFITIRPENLKASYVPQDSQTIVPELFKKFSDYNILFLPRYYEEREYAKGFSNIFIPDKPLNGLDVCYYSKAVLTGAGTFAREAVILGTPAVSFFPRKELLSVDSEMIDNGWMIHSRNPDEIHNYVANSKKSNRDNSRSKIIQKEILDHIEDILEKSINK